MAHDVFISHSHKDKTVADAVCAGLEAQHIRCWIAPRDVPEGEDWADIIPDAIGASRVLVLIFSKDSHVSRQVQREVSIACRREVTVIPLRLDSEPLRGKMDFFLGDIHWLDALTPPLERHINVLISRVQAYMNVRSIPQTGEGAHQGRELLPTPLGSDRRLVSWLTSLGWWVKQASFGFLNRTAAVVTAAGCLGVVYYIWHSFYQTPPADTILANAKELKAYGSEGVVRSVAFSPDGNYLSVAGDKGTTALIDGKTNKPIKNLTSTGESHFGTAFSPDSKQVATADSNYTATIWDLKTQKIIRVLDGQESHQSEGHKKPVLSVAFSHGGKRVLTTSEDGTAKIWNAKTGALLRNVVDDKNMVHFIMSACFSPDDKHLLYVSRSGSAAIDDLYSGKSIPTLEELELPNHDGAFSDFRFAAYSPTGDRIVTVNNNGAVRVWDVKTERVITNLSDKNSADETQDKRFYKAAFSPDGKLVVTTTGYRAAQIWDVQTGALVSTLSGHTAAVLDAVFSPDGRRVLTASEDHTARLWQVKQE